MNRKQAVKTTVVKPEKSKSDKPTAEKMSQKDLRKKC